MANQHNHAQNPSVNPSIQYKAICVYEAPTVDLDPDFIGSVNVVIGLFDTREQAYDACRNQPEHPAWMDFRVVRVEDAQHDYPYDLVCVMEVPTTAAPSSFPDRVIVCLGHFKTQQQAYEAFNQHPYADHPALISAGANRSLVDASRYVGGAQ